ncbi:MAG: asparagine synthase (glutamine-hydrolyzing) [Proteobacteria bacterium]|nr:asparagine synthase (glutamine-hydrolyzing) [Pseudomonadota bacterium]
MCGIAGFVLGEEHGTGLPANAEAARAQLTAMTDTMATRGPDGQGQWIEGPVALGHRRLSIIDLATGAQPMQTASGRVVVTFNGEIYNFRELRAELEAKGYPFATNSDTEVILNGWLAWGEACLDRFEGMFAFALWDRGTRTLFAARDRYGKKPFFYTLQNGTLAFASELCALRVLPFLHFSTTHAALARFLTYEYCPTPESIYKEVLKLPPAHFLIFKHGAVHTASYWTLPVPNETAQASEAELSERLLELLDKAVARRLVSDVPLGVFLSGGLDSSLVAALMARHSDRVKTFSIGFTEGSYDESSYARLVAKRLGTDHYERILSARDCGALLPDIVSRFDEPMSDPSIVPTYLLSALTRERVTVALSGDGGDELFAGYETFYALRLAEWYNRLPGFLRTGVVEPLARHLPMSSGYVNPRLAVQTFLDGAGATPWQRVQRWQTPFRPELLRQVMTDTPGLNLSPEVVLSTTRRIYDAYPATTLLGKCFAMYARQFLLDYILVKVDRCSMMHSLEVRAPLLDRDVAEFVWRLPLDMKLRGMTGKYLLRKAAAGLVPDEVLRRPKRGFLIPVAEWLRNVLRPLMEDLLSEAALRRQGIFEPKAVARLMDEHLRGQADHRRPLWTLLVLQLWLRKNTPTIV